MKRVAEITSKLKKFLLVENNEKHAEVFPKTAIWNVNFSFKPPQKFP